MTNQLRDKWKIGLFLFIVGLIGVSSILTMEIPLPEATKEMIARSFTPWQFKLVSLINPIVLLSIFTLVGTLLYDKVKFKLPIVERFVYQSQTIEIKSLLKHGIIGGVLGGVLITMTSILLLPYVPVEFIKIGETFKPSIAARLLYGGFTEEIMIRFGLMSLIVWLLFKIYGRLTNPIYWVGTIISAIIFGLLHLPFLYMLIENPTTALLFYILLGNAIGGIIYGWLYWKKGLETAVIAHVCTHLIILAGDSL